MDREIIDLGEYARQNTDKDVIDLVKYRACGAKSADDYYQIVEERALEERVMEGRLRRKRLETSRIEGQIGLGEYLVLRVRNFVVEKLRR